MAEAPAPAFKPKKSVALSGIAAGTTELCTVGRSGNDLAYRGYDILDIAERCEFEEIAHLLIHGKLPTVAELAGYKEKLRSLRGLPAAVKAALEDMGPSLLAAGESMRLLESFGLIWNRMRSSNSLRAWRSSMRWRLFQESHQETTWTP